MLKKTCALTVMCAACFADARGAEGDAENLRAQFESTYAEWRRERDEAQRAGVSPAELVPDGKTFRKLVALGPRAVPLAFEHIDEDPRLGALLSEVTKACLRVPRHRDESGRQYWIFADLPELGRFPHPPSGPDRWKAWAAMFRPKARAVFLDLVGEWEALKTRTPRPLVLSTRTTTFNERTMLAWPKTENTELGDVYERVERVGIDVLPLIVEQLKAGRYDYLGLFGKLTDGLGDRRAGSVKQRVRYAVRWWEEYKDRWTIPPLDDVDPPASADGRKEK